MNGNSITDLYIDDERRIWMANFPIGITVRDNRYADFQWIKHSIGNRQSLVNNRVNAIIEDRDGDLWFATDNGISLYNDRQEQWTSFLSINCSCFVPSKGWMVLYRAVDNLGYFSLV